MPLTNGWQGFCKKAITDLKPGVGKEFDMITASGISGQCVAFYAAAVLEIPFLLIRKEPNKGGAYGIKRTYMEDGDSHITTFYRKHNKPPKVIFIDDWIAGGGTRRETCEIVHQLGGDCVWEYLYADTGGRRKRYSEIDKYTHQSFGKVMDPRTGDPYKAPVVRRAATKAATTVKKPVARKPRAKAIAF